MVTRWLALKMERTWSDLMALPDDEDVFVALRDAALRFALTEGRRVRCRVAGMSFDHEALSDVVEAFAEAHEEERELPTGDRLPMLIVVDYLQHVKAEGGTRDQVATVARLCRQLAMRHDAVILAVSSVPRSTQELFAKARKAGDPRTLVAVGKEAAELEYSADAILALGVDWKKAATDHPAWVAIAKHRNGIPGFIDLTWDGERGLDSVNAEVKRGRGPHHL